MKTALVANGDIGDSHHVLHLLHHYPRIIAVDGGLFHCHAMGVVPDLIVGDFDSVDPLLLEQYSFVPHKTFPRDKDETDLELALKECLIASEDEGDVFGATGKRTDHTLANLQLLCRYPGRLRYHGVGETLLALTKDCRLPCKPGQLISLIPIGGPVEGVTTQGLRWELKDAVFSKNFFSVSNECLGDFVEVHIGRGDLICCMDLMDRNGPNGQEWT